MLDFLFKRCGGDAEPAVQLATLEACSEAGGALPHVTPAPPRCLTVLLVVLLISAAVCGGVLTYELGHKAELRTFNQRFDDLAASMESEVRAELNAKVAAAEMGALLLSTLAPSGTGSIDDVRRWRSFTKSLLQLSDSTCAGWIYVITDEDRPAFEVAGRTAFESLAPPGILNNSQSVVWPLPLAGPAPLYAVRWAVVPQNNESDPLLMSDALTRADLAENYKRVIKDGKAYMNENLVTPRIACSPDIEKTSPSSSVVAPSWVYVNGTERTVPVAGPSDANGNSIMSLSFQWLRLLGHDLRGVTLDGVHVVLTSPSGEEHAFEMHSGHQRSLDLGPVNRQAVGDMHHGKDVRMAKHARSINATVGVDVWRMELTPMRELYSMYVTNKPRNTALVVSFIVLLCLFAFGIYQWLVQRRAASFASLLDLNLQKLNAAQAHIVAERATSAHKEQFVSMVSHEIRTPLNAVSGGVTLLRATTPLSTEQRELLDILAAGAQHVAQVINDILSHAALTSGTFSVACEPLHLMREVIEPAWKMLELQRPGCLLAPALSYEVASDVPTTIMGDASRLVQVVTNLVGNAQKFTPPGGAVTLRVLVESNMLCFSVSDTGIGISPENLGRIFLPFVQAEATTTRIYGGIGLGLTICMRIARAMGGDVVAESAGHGQGTTITFSFPLRVPPPSEELQGVDSGASASPADSPTSSKISALSFVDSDVVAAMLPLQSPADVPAPRILVAEDDRLSQIVMRKMLVALNAISTIVSDGEQAVDAFRREEFDLVLMDLHMPHLDGLGATLAIMRIERERGVRRTPIVALTASRSAEEKSRCAEAGMAGHLSKPCRAAHLALLAEIVAAYRASNAQRASGG